MVLSLQRLFNDAKAFPDDNFDITCSYLEVYNEQVTFIPRWKCSILSALNS